MKMKSQLAALIGIAAMMDAPNLSMGSYPTRRMTKTSRSNVLPIKVQKWRAKEKRAKVSRKINWN